MVSPLEHQNPSRNAIKGKKNDVVVLGGDGRVSVLCVRCNTLEMMPMMMAVMADEAVCSTTLAMMMAAEYYFFRKAACDLMSFGMERDPCSECLSSLHAM
ncbi:hypothetical protein ZHAS_00018098 [Anopheles sinensis]|uniref:Uncharacterized protein n=1 Tax=Anopheles sinensis TaxID=74873 RepID=A0A084WIK6_ANOSI|nr:hypothetical protein ZHAS_00018098 [Anopheles sinensis]